ncbi:MAG: 16S rRNA processing protein RimM [Bdellovibrionales bacterium]|nr:16S rRNA processing protein RimM [Bdellovibrionales bacterium]
MSNELQKMIKIASVFHPHGIKGQAELRLLNDNYDESILEEGMKVYLYPASEKSQISPGGEEWVIQRLQFGNKVICNFEGMKDRTHLEKLLPFTLHVPRDAFPETENNEVYLVDLIDWEVVDVDGQKLGNLEGFSDNGQQYLFEVRLNDGSSLTLPYVDAFFPEIKSAEKKIVMIMPEYSE